MNLYELLMQNKTGLFKNDEYGTLVIEHCRTIIMKMRFKKF